MRGILQKSYSFKVNATINDILHSIKLNIGSSRILYHTHDTATFSGFTIENSFKIIRNSEYVSSYRPILYGDLIEEDEITLLKLKSRPNLFAPLFTLFCILFLIFINTISISYDGLGNELGLWIVVNLLLFLMITVVPFASYRYETKKALEELLKILPIEHNSEI